MKNCKNYQNNLEKFFNEELPEHSKEELFVHINNCNECKELFDEIKKLEENLHVFPKISPSPNFVSQVMGKIREEKSDSVSLLEKFKDMFMSPLALRLNMVVVSMLLLFLILKPSIYTKKISIPTDKNIITQKENVNVISNLNQNDLMNVKFLLSLPTKADNIEAVSVVGDFNKWDVNSFKLKHKGDGIWEGSFSLKPGKYEYMFVINGQKWIPDPKAKEFKEDGFGGKNSLLVL